MFAGPVSGYPGRGLEGRKKLSRQRFEHNDERGQAELGRLLKQASDNRLVTKMHTIKRTNCCDTTVMSGPQIVEASNQFHEV